MYGFFRPLDYLRCCALADGFALRSGYRARGLDCNVAQLIGERSRSSARVQHRLDLVRAKLRPTQPEQETTLPRAILRRTGTVESAGILVEGLLMLADNA